VLRCAITDRTYWPGNEAQKQGALIRQTGLWAEQGIDIIQLREKDLLTPALTNLAREILDVISSYRTRLFINSNVDAAIAAKAHGVHLPSKHNATTPVQVIHRYLAAGLPDPLITVSCHSLEEIERARLTEPDAILFAPVFGKILRGKTVTQAAGIEALRAACRAADPIPVFALGGVTHGRALLCIEAGAAGIAGVRLFHNPPDLESLQQQTV
jgi:thiamine-phosphate pyrophosphorylase